MTSIPPNSLAALGRSLPPRRNGGEGAAATLTAASPKPGTRNLDRIIRPEAQGRWLTPLASTYTPAYIEMILRGAVSGNHTQQWELFDLMEDTWPRLVKNLNQLKRSVIQLEWDLEAWAEEDTPPTDTALARKKLVSAAIWGMQPDPAGDGSAFEDILYDLLDAWAKGLSVLEVGWETRAAGALGQIAAPKEAWWVHPQHYAWGTNHQLGIVLPDSPNLDPFANYPDNFLIARCQARTGPGTGNALLRALAFWWAAANFNQSWLLNFAQIFGLPIRWANYDPNQPGLLEKVSDMLENMGSAAWGAFPAGTTLELKEPMKAGADNPQIALLDRADKNCDLLILGQSGTTEIAGPGRTGGSNAANQVLEGVEWKFVKAAADFAAGVMNRQFIPMILRLNFNQDTTEAPWFRPHLEEQEDQKANAERDQILLNAGVELPKAWLYERHNVPLPQPGEAVVGKPAVPGSPFGGPPSGGPKNERPPYYDPTQEDSGDPAATLQARRNRSAGPAAATMEDIVTEALAQGVGARRQWLAPLAQEINRLIAVAQSDRFTDADVLRLVEAGRARMPELFTRLDPSALSAHLNAAAGAAAKAGVQMRLQQEAVAA